MEEKYRLLFFKYLYELLNLDKYEKELEDNKIDYIKNKELMCDEEIICSIVSKYFYLLNEVDLIGLTEEEKNTLNSIDANNLDDTAKSFLEHSYNKVLLNSSSSEDIYYGPFMNQNFKAKNDEIALGIKFDEFGFVNGVLKKIEEIDRNDSIISDLIDRIEKSSNNHKLRIIKYNEIYKKLNEDNAIIM